MRENFQISVAKPDSGKHKPATSTSNRLGAEEVKILYFELNGSGTENVAMATKFLSFFAVSSSFIYTPTFI